MDKIGPKTLAHLKSTQNFFSYELPSTLESSDSGQQFEDSTSEK